jgi:Leucine Rich repeats (2 copies)/Fibronectin type III domain
VFDMSHHIRIVYLLMLVLIALAIASCSKDRGGIDGQDESADNTQPRNIMDLTVTEIAPTMVTLQWTAPGDDHDTGLATSYDLRYFLREITPSEWESSTAVVGLPVPSPPDSLDSVSVSGLMEDSTYFFAIRAVDDAGNWSGLSNVTKAMCIENYEVTFADTALERNIRFYVGKPIGSIFRLDLLGFEHLNLSNQHIYSISGIEHCINLQSLQLWNNHVTDLTPLAGLKHLHTLRIGYNGLTDISPLATVVTLDTLHLNANQIVDISALVGMNNLTELVLTSNAIRNTMPLAGKATIRNLSLDDNQIVYVNPLYNLYGLERLMLSNNQIDDLLPLSENPGLGAGDTIWLTNNPLSASSTDSLIADLRDRGVIIIL